LKSNWSKIINQHNESKFGSINDLSIMKNSDGYFLIGETPNSTSMIELVLENGKFYESKINNTYTKVQGSISATCSGCSGKLLKGQRQPTKAKDGYYCTECGQGNCEKSVTAHHGSILTSESFN
jgi:hypothetical protein